MGYNAGVEGRFKCSCVDFFAYIVVLVSCQEATWIKLKMTENYINNCEITNDFLSASIYDILLTQLNTGRDDVLKIRIANTSRTARDFVGVSEP